jgi:hypothetical protein
MKNRDYGRGKENAFDTAFIPEINHIQVICVPSDANMLVCDLIRDGLKSCSDRAEKLKVITGNVSFFATKCANDGLIKNKETNMCLLSAKIKKPNSQIHFA